MSEVAGLIVVVLLGLIWIRLGDLTLAKTWVNDIRNDLNDIRQTLDRMAGEIEVLATVTDDVADIRKRARSQFPTPEEYESDRNREP